MMRFANIPQLLSLPALNGMNQRQLQYANKVLVNGINVAYKQAKAGGPAFNRWFGGMLAPRAIIRENMHRMKTFANGTATLTFILKTVSPSEAYAWSQGGRSIYGQYILNVGSDFGNTHSDVVLVNNHAGGEIIRLVAHELCHLVFGANIHPPAPAAYSGPNPKGGEWYGSDALDLVMNVDQTWAAWNAENYAFFIEACSVW
jgi:hypothetical protein